LRAHVAANTYSQGTVLKLRKNGADGNQAVTVPATMTGVFEDVAHTDAFGESDDVNYSFSGGFSGSITISSIGLTERVGVSSARS